jgi:hypothetical protein
MAGKATSVYVQIVDSKTHKTVERKTFFVSSDANKYMKEQEEKYPKPAFYMVKETY